MHYAVYGAAATKNNANNQCFTFCVGDEFAVVYTEHSDFLFYNSESLCVAQRVNLQK